MAPVLFFGLSQSRMHQNRYARILRNLYCPVMSVSSLSRAFAPSLYLQLMIYGLSSISCARA